MENKIACKLVKLAKEILAGEIVIATNESYWQWEYDEDERLAKVYLNDRTGDLRLEITSKHTKTGLGKGVKKVVLEKESLGTINQARLGKVRSLLKKHSHVKSRSSSGFKAKWEDAKGRKRKLSEIISDYQEAIGTDLMSDDLKRQMIKDALDNYQGKALDDIIDILRL